MRTKTLWIKGEYLRLILAGRKTIEVRVGYSNITRLQVGDRLLLNDQHPFLIRRIGHYASFEELLAHEDAASMAPDVPPEQLLEKLRDIYPPEKEALDVVCDALRDLEMIHAAGIEGLEPAFELLEGYVSEETDGGGARQG